MKLSDFLTKKKIDKDKNIVTVNRAYVPWDYELQDNDRVSVIPRKIPGKIPGQPTLIRSSQNP